MKKKIRNLAMQLMAAIGQRELCVEDSERLERKWGVQGFGMEQLAEDKSTYFYVFSLKHVPCFFLFPIDFTSIYIFTKKMVYISMSFSDIFSPHFFNIIEPKGFP